MSRLPRARGWRNADHWVGKLASIRLALRIARRSVPFLGYHDRISSGLASALPYPEFVDELAGELFGDVEYGKSFYEHALCHSRAPCLAANHPEAPPKETN